MIKNLNDIKLIFALGNPEEKYEKTRHNIGIFFLKRIIHELDLSINYKKKLTSYVSIYNIEKTKKIYLVLSNTYMNKSGEALLQVMQYYKIKENEILIIHDDMSLKCSDMKLKFSGSHHGHNGIKNIILMLKTNKFHKFKIGIDKPQYRLYNTNYVIDYFTKEQKDKIENSIKKIIFEMKTNNFFYVLENMNE